VVECINPLKIYSCQKQISKQEAETPAIEEQTEIKDEQQPAE